MNIKAEKVTAKMLQDLLLAHKVPGMSVTLIKDGKIFQDFSVGTKDTQGNAVLSTTMFEAASLTKWIFSNIALKLCEQGLFSLDTPLLDWPFEHFISDERAKYITLRHCLSHATGLPNWADKPMGLAFEPGSAFSYSGEGYYLAQRIAQTRTGMDFPQLTSKYVFSHFGMKNSAVMWDNSVGQSIAQGFDEKGALRKTRIAPDLEGNAPEPNAAWSLYTTSNDYARFLCAIAQDGGGLYPSTWREAHSPQSDGGNGVLWGLGFGMVASDSNTLWHWGDNSGFKSFALIDIKNGDGAVALTNGDGGGQLCHELFKALTEHSAMDDIALFLETAE